MWSSGEDIERVGKLHRVHVARPMDEVETASGWWPMARIIGSRSSFRMT